MKRNALLLCALGTLIAPQVAAQSDDDLIPEPRSFVSPEHFALELRLGPYHPEMDDNDAFESFYADDAGFLLGLSLDVVAYRLPDVLYVAGAGGIGWADYGGNTLDRAGGRASEETSFEMIPLNLLAVLRVDALARKLSIPFIITGKLGYQWAHWSTESGGSDDESGWSLGILWGAQLALDLDFFEPAAARSLDEEWGINHSFLFIEVMGFEPNSDSLPIGDLTWAAGLGLTF